MIYTVDKIKKILTLEINRMGDFFVLEEFMDFFAKNIDKTILKDKGNFFLNNRRLVIINDYIENENERHFKNNERISFGFAIKQNNTIHSFDISKTGTLLKEYPSYILQDEKETPCNFYISNEDDIDVLLFKNDRNNKITTCETVYNF